MATITLRPTSATASSWSSIANAYDGSTTTSATVSIRKNNYSSRTATFNFNTSSIPSGATINSATLYVNAKASANSRITLYADVNGSSSSRVINSALTTTQGNQTADIKSYINSLSSVKLTGYISSNTSTTFTLYEVYIVVDYTEPLATYTVTFVDWNGTVLKTQEVEKGSNATPPSNPNRTGYTFSGWSGNYTNVTSNTEVTATYTVNSYTVTFKDWDGTTLKTETVNYQGSATAPSNPSRTGYTFSGWDKGYTNVTSNLTVTATYTLDTVYYTVTFVDWDNTVLKTQEVEEGSNATPPSNPTRERYKFYQWDKEYTNITSDIQIKALYHANALAIGNMKFNNIYLGNSKITSVYLGDMLLYEREKPLISLVSDGLIANLCEFDLTNRKMIDTVGSYDLTITGTSTTINDNNLTVANVSSNQGNIILPMTELTQFTFSYVVESNWSGNQPTQIISGQHTKTFYMWFMTNKMNIYYNGTNVIVDADYTTIGNDNVKFIDAVLDITNGTCQLYANGELKVSKTGYSLNQATDNNLYLNNTSGWTSIGNFTLYSFKVYNRCLNQEEIQKNINYEKTKLGWT